MSTSTQRIEAFEPNLESVDGKLKIPIEVSKIEKAKRVPTGWKTTGHRKQRRVLYTCYSVS